MWSRVSHLTLHVPHLLLNHSSLHFIYEKWKEISNRQTNRVCLVSKKIYGKIKKIYIYIYKRKNFQTHYIYFNLSIYERLNNFKIYKILFNFLNIFHKIIKHEFFFFILLYFSETKLWTTTASCMSNKMTRGSIRGQFTTYSEPTRMTPFLYDYLWAMCHLPFLQLWFWK